MVPTRQSCLADYSRQEGQLLERSNTNILTPQDCLDSIWMGNEKLQNLYHKKKREVWLSQNLASGNEEAMFLLLWEF